MGSPVQIRRCGHIRISGTQCGSPSVRGQEFCYYHQQNKLQSIEVHLGAGKLGGEMVLPVLEDAHSIQMVVRQVMRLLLQQRIDRRDASLLFYGLQIASGNLKQMLAEKPKPTHVVVDPEKTNETPIGMTPWSDSHNGHDFEVEPAVMTAELMLRQRKVREPAKPEDPLKPSPVPSPSYEGGGREFVPAPSPGQPRDSHTWSR